MLTDTAVKKAGPADKQYRLSDERGMHLLVRPNGAKLWQLRYRHDGKEKTESLGQYPDVGLSAARIKRDDARKLIAAGTDPVAAKQSARALKAAGAVHNFEAVARQWFVHWKSSKSPRHADYVMARLEADVFPAIGTRPVCEIEAPELVKMIKAIEMRGALDIAKRCMQMSAQVFRYAIAHGVGGAKRNPATDIRPADVLTPRKKENYARIEARELPGLLRKIEGYQGTPTTRLAIKLMAHTFVRTGELIAARWSEFDLDGARWDIPAARMKMKSPHVVPLSTQVVLLLRVLHEVTGTRALLFPGERDHEKSMSNNTILGALDRMGYKNRMTGHGFRGLASTILHELDFDHQHIELQLAHTERNSVSAAYNHALYLKQRTIMMQAWSDYVEGATRDNVLPLRQAA
jgi:integrase